MGVTEEPGTIGTARVARVVADVTAEVLGAVPGCASKWSPPFLLIFLGERQKDVQRQTSHGAGRIELLRDRCVRQHALMDWRLDALAVPMSDELGSRGTINTGPGDDQEVQDRAKDIGGRGRSGPAARASPRRRVGEDCAAGLRAATNLRSMTALPRSRVNGSLGVGALRGADPLNLSGGRGRR